MAENCVYCMLYPIISISIAFGDISYKRCDCRQLNARQSKIIEFYRKCILIVLVTETIVFILQNLATKENVIFCSPIERYNGREMHPFLKMAFYFINIGSIVCIHIAFAYDSFQEIRIFASARLAIEDKIKLMDFMKKFRENELGFSCGGFFVASKGCPVKAYDSFQEIRIFASARLSVEDKIKLLDFMKKFRENELGFSCGGFFVASKGCPVKVYSSLYSAFNILLQVRDILKGGDNKCISFAAHILNLSQNSTLLQK
ncbi:uncharacterized protein [Centruroides vittatus]|uniref:uncharacterized protein n=1 Tax=Centruroides vittatus TaxID=120091 RepID=UPI0035102047